MRPNELFALTTEMWGTRLSAESPPADANGTQRHSFWICGIVARPKTTLKPNAIQPRNPLMQQAYPQDRQTSHHAAPPHPGGQAFLRPQPQSASARLYERGPAPQVSSGHSSARSYAHIAQPSSSQTHYTSSTAYNPAASGSVSDQRTTGTSHTTAPRDSLTSYGSSRMSGSSTYITHAPPLSHAAIPDHARGVSYPQSQHYHMPTAAPSMPAPSSMRHMPPPTSSLTALIHAPPVDHASASKGSSPIQSNSSASVSQQPIQGSGQPPNAEPNRQHARPQ